VTSTARVVEPVETCLISTSSITRGRDLGLDYSQPDFLNARHSTSDATTIRPSA
jgi:hypothetical protein